VPQVTRKFTLPANLRAKSGQHACLTSDCHKGINVWLKDGSSTGYCSACAEQYAPVTYSEHKSVRECSVVGCTKNYKLTVEGKRYCSACNPDEESKRRRAEEKKLYEAKRWLKKKAKLSK
jgi:hypothetical protein